MFKRAILATLAAACMGVVSAPAQAMTHAPGWMINSHSYPTNLAPGSSGYVNVDVYDVGGAPSLAGAIVTDTLPQGVSAETGNGWTCGTAARVTCTHELEALPGLSQEAELELEVTVNQGAAEGSFPNEVTVAGGGAPNPASASNRFTVSATPAHFGFADADAWFTNADGTTDTQAGSHPYEVTFDYDVNTAVHSRPVEETRNIAVNLPPGLVGNPTAVPQCSRQQFDKKGCPASSQIGVAPTGLGVPAGGLPNTFEFPVYNLTPPPGVPAEFAFSIFGIHAILDAGVRSDGDYGITEHVDDVPQRAVVRSRVTLWGVPADPSHDVERCTVVKEELEECDLPSSAQEVPFLTLPTSCEGAQPFSISSDAWGNSGATGSYEFLSHDGSGALTGFTGCDRLGFQPTITVAPDTSYSDTPAGLTVEVKMPQEGLADSEALSISNIKNTTVVLPKGVVINPGQAAGLQACQAGEDAVGTQAAPSCPNASKVGTDEIESPLLKNSLKGNVYVLQSNPPNLQLLVAASGEGVNLKLVGDVHLDEATGQLSTTFSKTPELPFTSFKLAFSGGAQAALATPTTCGTYTTTSDFMPWSTPAVGDAFPVSNFTIDSGPGGDGTGRLQRAAAVQAELDRRVDDRSGGRLHQLLAAVDAGRRPTTHRHTPVQDTGGVAWHDQQGSPVPRSTGECGHELVRVSDRPHGRRGRSGTVPAGGAPTRSIAGADLLTEGYKGAPYGLSIVVPLHVGPFTLQTQVVRARIEVNPITTQLTVTTDPLPTIIDGIPADLRAINAVIDRPGFMFNPTGCEPSSFSGTATSSEGASAPIGSHFQMGSCRALTFKPNFKVSTSGKTSRKNGASLDAKILTRWANLETIKPRRSRT